jgi:hypothetical protein
MMARHLQQELPSPPEWGMKEMSDSGEVTVPVNDRAAKIDNDMKVGLSYESHIATIKP